MNCPLDKPIILYSSKKCLSSIFIAFLSSIQQVILLASAPITGGSRPGGSPQDPRPPQPGCSPHLTIDEYATDRHRAQRRQRTLVVVSLRQISARPRIQNDFTAVWNAVPSEAQTIRAHGAEVQALSCPSLPPWITGKADRIPPPPKVGGSIGVKSCHPALSAWYWIERKRSAKNALQSISHRYIL